MILAIAGTTPGKAILNVKLTDDKGLTLSFLEAVKRGWDIFYRGYALGIYPISLFTQAWQKQKLNRDGKTSWDERYGLKVTHRPIGASRIAGFTVAFLLLYLFVTVMSVVVTAGQRETGIQSKQPRDKVGKSVNTMIQGENLKDFNIDEWEPVESK